ncbi:MAG: TIGR03790 family protein [Verrucomicrobiae bacterium]|nr:TIGR03790 family protein [Verrucomicrobiae bacterium]
MLTGFASILCVAGMWMPQAHGQNPAAVDYSQSTLVVCNANVPESVELAKFYAEARGIPRDHVVPLKCPAQETITRDQYRDTIEGPLRALFDLKNWWIIDRTAQGPMAVENKMRVVAVIYGMPLRIASIPLPPKTDPETGKPVPQKPVAGADSAASVDSELMRLGILSPTIDGPMTSPYFDKDVPIANAKLPMMMVAGRIDGPTAEDAKRLITDALITETTGLWGKVYVDLAQKTQGSYKDGEEWIGKAGQNFLLHGFPAVVDVHGPTFPINYPMGDAAAYFGWYTGHADGPFKNPNFRFRKGAIAAHLHSYSATSLRTDSNYWVGPLVSKGAAAVLGNVYEPFLSLTTHFDIFADRLLKGYTIAESAAMGTQGISWMTIVVGDPLYRPFAKVDPEFNRRQDYDYKTFYTAMQRWGTPKEKKNLVKNLEKAAKTQNSGNLYEALAQLSQEFNPDKPRASSNYYDDAFSAFSSPVDKLRVRLLQIDLVRRTYGKERAVGHLKELVADGTFASIPEIEAAKALLLQLDPPPPAPPADGKKK